MNDDGHVGQRVKLRPIANRPSAAVANRAQDIIPDIILAPHEGVNQKNFPRRPAPIFPKHSLQSGDL